MFPAPNTAAAGQTAPVTDPNANITEEEKNVAILALADFEKNNLDTSIGSLNKLLKTRPQDAKVILNKEVALYCKSGHRKTDEFIQGLTKACEMVSTTCADLVSGLRKCEI